MTTVTLDTLEFTWLQFKIFALESCRVEMRGSARVDLNFVKCFAQTETIGRNENNKKWFHFSRICLGSSMFI